ncbi:MAG TPA: dihydrolipoamide acetyltransferase family protein [Solirubrobacteraceae bacterium]|jgi:pyruvate dehydrogenase E2 component (dihydrolipoamide acetyltransferase)|nr:dihydrolipoamide acetyltransferase family protein [Solirubrobacteraceae bacterium]
MSTGELVMPRLSDTMEEGTILRWLKADGDSVERGEELVEIETDKATMTYESDLAGVLRIVAGEGATLAVGELIATVGEAGETPPSQPAQPESAARVKASPLARRIAGKSGIDLHEVTGSGPGGRIVKADVESSAADGPGASPAPDAGTTPPVPAEGVATAKGQTTDVELTRTQQTIARRMAESKATIPDFSIQAEVDMEACVTLRSDLKRLSQGERSAEPGADAPLATPTYNDMVLKACALALREHPRANGSYRDGRLQLHSRINVGVAVAAEDALVVPTVFDAEEKSLGEIARETRRLAERVRDRTITPPELGGGTFTVSNLGMYGVRSFTAIVNPPQAAILSVGSLGPRAVAREGELTVRNTMMLTLVCDHRILYGADAAQLLARIRELLEAPAALTL